MRKQKVQHTQSAGMAARKWAMGLALGALLVTGAPGLLLAQGQASSPEDAKVQAEMAKALDSKNFQNVQVQVQNGVATLTGTVSAYGYKVEAYDKVHHKEKQLAIRDEIAVATVETPDAQIQQKLAKKISYDRVGYGTTMFDAVTVTVQNGVVTLGGNVYWDPDRQAAVSDAAFFPGVKDVIDNIQVDPVSQFDDQTRMAVARAVYGSPVLNQYAIDPAKPIRITVINGNVTLSGMVDDQMQKDTAGIMANSVSNVFKVTNNLQVEHPSKGK